MSRAIRETLSPCAAALVNGQNPDPAPGFGQSAGSPGKQDFSNDWNKIWDDFWKQKGHRGQQNKGRTRIVRQLRQFLTIVCRDNLDDLRPGGGEIEGAGGKREEGITSFRR